MAWAVSVMLSRDKWRRVWKVSMEGGTTLLLRRKPKKAMRSATKKEISLGAGDPRVSSCL